MSDIAALAADWINQTPKGVYPRVRCHRSVGVPLWYVSVYADEVTSSTLYHTDAELAECAKVMGWNPEPAADPNLPVEFQGHDWEGWKLTEDPKRGKWMWRNVAGDQLRIDISGELSIVDDSKVDYEQENYYLCRGPVAKSKHIADLIIEGMAGEG